MVGKLAGRGFAVKRAAEDNDKEVLVFLTEQGWEAFRAHRDFHERHIDTMIRCLGEYSLDQLTVTDQLLEVLEAIMHDRMRELFGE